MSPVTQQALRNAYGKLNKAYEEITFALGQAMLAKSNGGPDFTTRIETLQQSADNLASDINEAAPEIEPHDGVGRLARGELTPKEERNLAEIKG